jgi:hypothetical protein
MNSPLYPSQGRTNFLDLGVFNQHSSGGKNISSAGIKQSVSLY